MAGVTLDRVSKEFERGHTAIDELSLTFEDGMFTVLLGPSGCGKTTLLRMIAGIGQPTRGRVLMNGLDITDVPPGKRDVAMVFQNYAVYPMMNVRENIEFCLKNRRVLRDERERRVIRAAETVGLLDCLDRMPSELSGGQRQRVALARAIVKEPKVFLMDEPLSNLDAKLRTSMRSELIMLHKSLGATFIYVTHDQTESMAMADKIVLMNGGKIVQTGTPEQIYGDPADTFAAEFIGSPAANIIRRDGGGSIGIRPERIAVSPGRCTGSGANAKPACGCNAKPAYGCWTECGTIVTRENQGADINYRVRISSSQFVTVRSTDFSFSLGDDVTLSADTGDIFLFDEDGRRIRETATQNQPSKLVLTAAECAV